MSLRVEVGETVARLDRDRACFPIDLHSDDIVDRLHQTLIAQIPDCQVLRGGAERHQRENLVLVDVDGQRMLAGDRDCALLAVLIDRIDIERRRTAGIGQ